MKKKKSILMLNIDAVKNDLIGQKKMGTGFFLSFFKKSDSSL